MIQSKWNLYPDTVNKFLNRYPEDPNSNNCRYDLIFTWVKQNKITFRQFKILVKNIRIRDISQWKQMNGDYLFPVAGEEPKTVTLHDGKIVRVL
jgi:hypothetical protein